MHQELDPQSGAAEKCRNPILFSPCSKYLIQMPVDQAPRPQKQVIDWSIMSTCGLPQNQTTSATTFLNSIYSMWIGECCLRAFASTYTVDGMSFICTFPDRIAHTTAFVHHEGLIWWPTARWVNTLTIELVLDGDILECFTISRAFIIWWPSDQDLWFLHLATQYLLSPCPIASNLKKKIYI